ncbi:baseplate J/gp47 family protein [Bengtsoniella intestinalis]|uniref:baseplate J/gp47 family protein n=1 Tax=Bengtsoniella intestinalis TaxID=3073143 RepID=UPI00391F0919
MYETKTYASILSDCLSTISADLDTREGSIIYDALAPTCAQLAIFYTELSTLLDRAFPDTATSDDLDRKAAERGIAREQATYAQYQGLFLDGSGNTFTSIEGSRFSGGGVNYTLTDSANGILTVETAGDVTVSAGTTLLPLEYHADLASATLGALLISGAEIEDDDTLRSRYFASFESQSFGGNIADYQSRTQAMDGVGGAKIIRAASGGGTVEVILVGSDWAVASDALVSQVQTALDPTQNQGDGVGLAPIGHTVTVSSAQECSISVGVSLTLDDDTSWANLESEITQVIQDYFTTLTETWANTDNLIVRISQIETRLLEINGIIDIEGTTLNDLAKNITLEADEIPTLEEVSAL